MGTDFKRNMMLNIFDELIQTADNSLLREFLQRLEDELSRSNNAIKEGFEGVDLNEN